MADPSPVLCVKNSELCSVDMTVWSPDGKPLSIVISGDPDQIGFMTDLLENAEEYLGWLMGERMGSCPPGVSH
jgi:hypothetical protein